MAVRVFIHRGPFQGQLGLSLVKAGKPRGSVKGQAPFECFWGNPYRDANGEWRCPSGPTDPPPGTGGVKSPPQEPQTTKPGNPNPAAAKDDDGLIFGFEPKTLLIAGAIAAGLYFMSQSGGTKEKTL